MRFETKLVLNEDEDNILSNAAVLLLSIYENCPESSQLESETLKLIELLDSYLESAGEE